MLVCRHMYQQTFVKNRFEIGWILLELNEKNEMCLLKKKLASRHMKNQGKKQSIKIIGREISFSHKSELF